MDNGELREHSGKLAGQVRFLLDPSFWQGREIPPVLAARLSDRSDGTRKEILRLLGKGSAIGLICDSLQFKVESLEAAKALSKRLSGPGYARGKLGIRDIHVHRPDMPDDDDSPHAEGKLMIALLKFGDEAIDEAVERRLISDMEKIGGEAENLIGELYVVKNIDAETVKKLVDAGEFNYVHRFGNVHLATLDDVIG